MKQIKFTLLAFTLSAVIGWSNIARAQCTIDQSQPLTDGGTSERNLPGYYDGQTFTAGATGLLCEIDLMMFNTMTGTGILKIYSGAGITGTLLDTQVVHVNVPSGQVWQDWVIASPPPVVSGSVYTFQFIPIQGGGLPDPYGINVQDSNKYAGGYDLSLPTFDLTFRTYVEAETNINELYAENNFVIYPNPSEGKFTITNNGTINSIEVYNYLGEKVYGEEFSTKPSLNQGIASRSLPRFFRGSQHQIVNEIDLSGFPKGIYFVKINSRQNIKTEKIVIQ
jgi:hypothetical protein